MSGDMDWLDATDKGDWEMGKARAMLKAAIAVGSDDIDIDAGMLLAAALEHMDRGKQIYTQGLRALGGGA